MSLKNNMQTPYAYVISLKEREDRRKIFKQNADYQNLDFEFVDAIKGEDNLISKQFACSISHLKAISKFLNSNKEWCIIFEDDADLCSNFVEHATDKMEKTLQANFNFCYLGGFGFATDTFTSNTWKDWKGRCQKINDGLYKALIVDGAHCYSINKQSANQILNVATAYLKFFESTGFVPSYPIVNHNNPGFDNILNDLVIKGIVKATVCYPVLSNQLPGFSNIENEELSRPLIDKILQREFK
jgi:GR25 family glycosyltransferase involved in LPS biosynthesis